MSLSETMWHAGTDEGRPKGYVLSYLIRYEKVTKLASFFIQPELKEKVLKFLESRKKGRYGIPILEQGEFEEFYYPLLYGKTNRKKLVIKTIKSIIYGRIAVRGRKNAKRQV